MKKIYIKPLAYVMVSDIQAILSGSPSKVTGGSTPPGVETEEKPKPGGTSSKGNSLWDDWD